MIFGLGGFDGCFSVGKQAVDELKDVYKRKIVWKSRHRGCELRIAQCSADAAFCTMWLNLYMFDQLLLFPPTVLNESEILCLFQYEVQVNCFHECDENIIPAHFSIP